MSKSPLSYAFHSDEKISRGFLRILGEISREADILAHASQRPIADLIHEERLLIKRTRALLWFARPALTKVSYQKAKTQARKAAGLLAAQRDFTAMQITLGKLARKTSKNLFKKLLAKTEAGRMSELPLRKTFRKSVKILLDAIEDLKHSAATQAKWPSVSRRVEQAFHAMRKAEKRARRRKSNSDFHEWRKKSKLLLYLVELAHPKPTRRFAHRLKRVAKLQEKLGAYHDCVVVESRFRPLLSLVALEQLKERKKHLQSCVFRIGQHLKNDKW
jgi:CHAD domain-containing protein